MCYAVLVMYRRAYWPRLVLAAALFAALAAPTFAQQPEIEKLAAELALKLNQPKWALTGEVKIVVVGFQGPDGEASLLGAVLASRFAKALLREAGNFKLVEHSEFSRVRKQELWSEDEASDRKVARSIALEAGAALFITGNYGRGKEQVRLEVRAARVKDDRVLGEVRTKIPFPVELQRLAELPPPKLSADSEANSDAASTPPESVPRAGKAGVGYPECVRCEDPTFTPEARAAKYEARVMLRLLVTQEGNAVNVRVEKGAQYGLTEAALKAVRKWKFKPALHNGKPVPVEIQIEVTFRLL